jgi:hypothetical protein
MKRLSGLVLIAAVAVAACNRPAEEKPAAPAPAAAAYTPHGNLAQVMRGIPFPSSNIIFDTQSNDPAKAATQGDTSKGATSAFSGVYGGWQAVENAAIAIEETANLIMIPGRMCSNGQPVPNDQEDFKKWAANLADAGAAALKAAQAKNLDQMVDVSGTVSDACAMCHEKYRDTPNQPMDRCMVKK